MSEDNDILKVALDRFEMAAGAEGEWRTNATADLRFCANDQWDAGARSTRALTGRPCLTSDRISPAVRQIVNESRQNRPAIEVDPKGDGANVDTAHIIAGLIRDIEYQSNADTAYDTAEEYAVKTGLGYFRLFAEYEAADTFDQVLRVKLIDDPLSVYFDPDHHEADGSDAEWAFIVKELDRKTYSRLYNQTDLAKMTSWGRRAGFDAYNRGWVGKDRVRVAEYFYKVYTEKTLYHIAEFIQNAQGVLQFFQETTTFDKPSKEDLDSKRAVILNTRTATETTVKWDVLNGHEVISSSDWPGCYIPVFPVKGEEFWVDGKRITMGAVRRARDMQQIINFMVSEQVEAIDLSNKAPFIVAAGQIDTFEEMWANANQRNYAYLEYNQVDTDGKQAPAPYRAQAEPPIQAISATRTQAADDLKAIFGIYEAAEGAMGNETSGVAIIARKEQSSNSNFHYYDNLVRAIKHLGRVLVDVIPTYYDTARSVRIVKPNGEQEVVAINQYIAEKDKKYDMSTGKYDVIVKTGPSYQTKRQKMVENASALIAQYPAAGPAIADLVVAASDFEGNMEIAARLRAMVPQAILDATGENDDQAGDPKAQLAAVRQKLQQATQAIQALNAHAQQVEQELKNQSEENALLKQKTDADLVKAQLQYNIDAQRLALDEATAELEFLSAQQKNNLASRQLDIQERQAQVKAVVAASDMVDKMHEKETAYLDNSRDKTIATISDIKPLPELETPNVDVTKVAEAAPLGDHLGGKFG
jgi:hypothetical protein